MTHKFDLIALTPSGQLDPSVAIAASRAGEFSVLDLEYLVDDAPVHQTVAMLARYARNDYGFKLSCQQGKLLSELLVQASEHLNLVLLTGHDPQLLQPQIEAIHQKGLRILFEATNLNEARLGEDLGVDGIVAKGHEAGGYVGEETTFVLLQQFLTQLSLPIYAQGGIGLRTVAACYAAGAAGAILDTQLFLTRESRLSTTIKDRIAAMDGSETVCLGNELGECYRVYFKPGLSTVQSLRHEEEKLLTNIQLQADEKKALWRNLVCQRVGWADPNHDILPLGQDAAFAAPLARDFVTVSGILSAIRKAVETHCETASRLCPLNQGTALAQSHGTRYPIVQGPMTRVSDNASFALEVAKAGGLPFLALALMRKADAVSLLEETRQKLGKYPWGVGILGFVPTAVRQEQLEAIQLARPTFALIAGGRPDQAFLLENEGIPTYLHVPSPDLLKLFLAEGSRRFVFEGRECGGHVGPRSSFVLWETMINLLLEHLDSTKENAHDLHILFAGGIHDGLSAAMVATMVAPLAERGVCIGVLMGTSYLFTQEAVTTKAIVPGYQEEALRSDRTILLETGPGHAIRCLSTPYVQTFAEKKQSLQRETATRNRMRDELEALNLGRLYIASKGMARHPQYGQASDVPKYVTLNQAEQQEQGMYMIGQVATLCDEVCTIEALHQKVSIGSSAILETFKEKQVSSFDEPQAAAKPSQIAIIGLSCILPGATSLQTYWENILDKVDAVTEVPRERWDWKRYFDSDRSARDKIYSKWGGFIDDIPFNPLDYGMPPNSISSVEPVQLLMLEVVRRALTDAGYLTRPFPKERTSVIVGVGGGLGDLGNLYGFRAYLPHFLDSESSEVISHLSETLPEWTEDSFPGILLNVVAGRIANRFDLGGPNFTVDAACGSSLAALDVAIKDLEAHRTDMAIVGAGDTVQSPFAFLAFSKTQALSPTGRCRPFDANADGIAISEGLAVVVLKRLQDAERDGDRIYAVIQGVGASSDGKDKGLTAPRPAGQLRALRRAYAHAGISSATVGLIEAHGTGTRVGDAVEVEALNEFFQAFQPNPQMCAIGSVKSMIGHTKSTAGLASLIKVAMALYHKILPPTLVDKPNSKITFSDSPFYVNDETRPWLTGTPNQIRRAGVSAFGFGGTNFHAVLEEYRDDYLLPQASRQTWPAELLLWRCSDRASLLSKINKLQKWLSSGNEPPLRDLAYSHYLRYRQLEKTRSTEQPADFVLSIVATSQDDFKQKLTRAKAALSAGDRSINDPLGIYFTQHILSSPDGMGKIVFLFPGQGSQYPNMLRDLALSFPQVRACFECANQVLKDRLPKLLSDYIFPIPPHSDSEAEFNRQSLTDTRIAQPALGVAGLALSNLLKKMGVQPDIVAGHSYGELVALCEASVISQSDLFILSEARGRFMMEATGPESGTMAAVKAERHTVEAMIKGINNLTLANLNSPTQIVISGPQASVAQAVQRFQVQGISARVLPIACAFHSPLVAPASKQLAEFIETIEFGSPNIDVFSNTTGEPYPRTAEAIRTLLAEHLIRPVEFQREVEAMYAAGIRIFVEVGPRSVLSDLVNQTLENRPHLAIPIDQPGGSGLVTLQKALGQLAACGVSLHLEPLYEGRVATQIDFSRAYEERSQARLGPTTWLVNGSRARPQRDVQNDLPESNVTPLKVTLGGTDTDSRRKNADIATSKAVNTDATVMNRPASPKVEQVNGDEDEVNHVVLQHQQLMSHFLEVQKNIMLTYLEGTPITLESFPATSSTTVHPTTKVTRPAPSSPDQVEIDQETAKSPSPIVTPEPSLDDETNGRAINSRQSALEMKTLTQELLTLVSERTGYPPEMLDLDADLEADLGIDSIKRVEILGSFRKSHPKLDRLLSGQGLEQLQTQRTLRTIVGWIESQAKNQQASLLVSAAEAQGDSDAASSSVQTDSILRFGLTPVEAPLNNGKASLITDRVILITDDGQDVGRALADTLRSQGHRVVIVAHGQKELKTSSDFFTADLTNPKSVGKLLDMIRQEYGPIGSLLHLASLSSSCLDLASVEFNNWRECLRHGINSLFHLIQGLHEDLVSSAQAGGACLLAATDMGGAFAFNGKGETPTFFPGHGGLAGLLKTVAHEWPAVRVKAVDVNLNQDSSLTVQALLQELSVDDDLIEVGYDGTARKILQMTPLSLDETATSSFSIDSQSVILVTGGARGITAQVTRELATRYQPVLLLVGRSPLPTPTESPQTAGLTSTKSIKEALIASLRQDGQNVSLAEVETVYKRLLREREIRANLEAMQLAGATVQYYQVDVRDEAAFGTLIDDIYRTYSRLDGVIHGAGIIEDKLIKDKTPKSFEQVISTKVDSAFILSRKLRSDTLKFLVFFSSVSGRFGNKGQSDYAVANEILNKLAIYLDHRWLARVVSVNWGPWDALGMVSPELRQEFTRRGITLTPIAIGRQRFIEELTLGRKGEVEIMICGEDVQAMAKR